MDLPITNTELILNIKNELERAERAVDLILTTYNGKEIPEPIKSETDKLASTIISIKNHLTTIS